MNKDLKAFIRHCLQDDEFLCGGIPTKESYYFKKLGWEQDSAEADTFYKAMVALYYLGRGELPKEMTYQA